ncbi:MAG TPA: endopeptidase La [Caldilineae bacterium]|nr:endopeptidase La [Caldilineae bacterium]
MPLDFSGEISFFGPLVGPLEEDFEEREEEREEQQEFIVVPLRNTVVFPRMMAPLLIGRNRSVRAVEAATSSGLPLLVVAQRDADQEDPGPEDLYTVGTEVLIVRTLRMPDGSTSILCQGRQRVQIEEFTQEEPFLQARGTLIWEEEPEGLPTEALMRAVLALFEKCVELNPNLPEEAYIAAMNVDEPGWLADLIASVLDMDVEEKQELLETFDTMARLQRLSILLGRELDVLELENRIHQQVQEEMDRSQREYFLREQMRVIQNELGETDEQTREINELRERLEAAGLPEEVFKKAEKELDRLAAMPPIAPEVAIIRTYLDWLIELPWKEATEDNMDIAHAAKVLDANHYGLPKAKERILEYIAVRKLAPDKMRQPILCFVGPPGTGKTSMGRSIAEALGRKFVRMSLGGIRDEAEIRGHRRTYIGAMPGRIIQTMRTAGTVNPLFMLDEIDKIGLDFRGDPAAALLEVLDPEQNHAFVDHYLDVPYDLSKVMFITTANVLDTVPPALRDRMEVIEFPGYIEEEKLAIARQFLVPRQIKENGLEDHKLSFSDQAIRLIIREYTYEAGVRNLERCIARICRKVARQVAEGRQAPSHITAASLSKYLGPPEYTYGRAEERDEVGVATGLAVTEGGGDLLSVEVTLMEGKGGLLLTGQLGEIMQESAQAALSYARSHAKKLGFGKIDFDKIDIHVHVPEGAIPKDGPSAGITIATALISALSERPVRHEVGMTGEITLRGRVLPVGGLKEKILAAHRAGLKTVVIPKRNDKDLIEIPKRVKRDLEIILVDHMEEVLRVALVNQKGKAKPKRAERRPRAPAVTPAAAASDG